MLRRDGTRYHLITAVIQTANHVTHLPADITQVNVLVVTTPTIGVAPISIMLASAIVNPAIHGQEAISLVSAPTVVTLQIGITLTLITLV